MRRTIIVGDIHGCVDELNDLIYQIKFNPLQDCLYSVGDVVGKGPESLRVLKKLKELGTKTIRGNHEDKLLRLSKEPFGTLNSREKKYITDLDSELDFWVKEISNWKFYLEGTDFKGGAFVIVHAGLEPFKTHLSEMSSIVLTRVRNWPMVVNHLEGEKNFLKSKPWFEWIDFQKVSFPNKVIFGHWAQKGLVNLEYVKGLDTGCVYGKRLTAYCLEEDLFYFVESKKVYCSID